MIPKIIRTAGDKAIRIYQFGAGNGSITLMVSSDLPEMEHLSGVNILVEKENLEDLKSYLSDNLVEDVARDTGLSRAEVSRLRKAVGVQKKYPGDSPVTQWRRRKRQVKEEDSID